MTRDDVEIGIGAKNTASDTLATVGRDLGRLGADVSALSRGMATSNQELAAAQKLFHSTRVPVERLANDVAGLQRLYHKFNFDTKTLDTATRKLASTHGLTGSSLRQQARAIQEAQLATGKYTTQNQRLIASLHRSADAIDREANAKRRNAQVTRWLAASEQTRAASRTVVAAPATASSGGLTALGGLRGLAAFGAAAFAVRQAVAGVQHNLDIEATVNKFEVFLGSAERAKELVEDLRKFDLRTTFSFADTTQAAEKLLNFGVAGKDVMRDLEALGNVAAGNRERFSRLALAYGQATAMGKLQGQETRQMVEAGFNPLQAIAKMTGETMAEVTQRQKDGAIAARELAEALKAATSEGGRFFGMIDKRAETTKGQTELLGGELRKYAAEWMGIPTEIFSKGVRGTREVMKYVPRPASSIQDIIDAEAKMVTNSITKTEFGGEQSIKSREVVLDRTIAANADRVNAIERRIAATVDRERRANEIRNKRRQEFFAEARDASRQRRQSELEFVGPAEPTFAQRAIKESRDAQRLEQQRKEFERTFVGPRRPTAGALAFAAARSKASTEQELIRRRIETPGLQAAEGRLLTRGRADNPMEDVKRNTAELVKQGKRREREERPKSAENEIEFVEVDP